jgi:predicted small integral membrane protein
MTIVGSLLLFKLILTIGLALWMTVVVLNNVIAFRSGVAAVGRMMSMQLFDQEPAIKTPLLARRVESSAWHRLIYTLVLVVDTVVAVLLWYAVLAFAGALLGTVDAAGAIRRANLALSAFAIMSFLLLLGGAWFAYYIRQDVLQLTHFALIAVVLLSAIVVNLPGG